MPKKAWFQFHLSTALVATFAASLFLWVNIVPERFKDLPVTARHGWPLTHRTDSVEHYRLRFSGNGVWHWNDGKQVRIHPGELAFNVVFAIVNVLAIAALFECVTRKREEIARVYWLLNSRAGTYAAMFIAFELWFWLQSGGARAGWPCYMLADELDPRWGALIADVVLMCGLCGGAAALVEWLIRRQGDTHPKPETRNPEP